MAGRVGFGDLKVPIAAQAAHQRPLLVELGLAASRPAGGTPECDSHLEFLREFPPPRARGTPGEVREAGYTLPSLGARTRHTQQHRLAKPRASLPSLRTRNRRRDDGHVAGYLPASRACIVRVLVPPGQSVPISHQGMGKTISAPRAVNFHVSGRA